LLVTVSLDLGGLASAQELKDDPPSETGASAEQPSRSPSPGHKLPVEDPTIHEERGKALKVRSDPDPSPDDAQGDPGSEAGQVTLGIDEEQSVGALPVEDPTLDVAEPEEREAEEDSKSTKPASKGDSEQTKEWGQKVQVAYGYHGGLLVGVDDWFYLSLSGLVQARYSVNYRTKPPTDVETGVRENQVTQGFDIGRARFHLGIGLTEFVALYMRVGVVAGGDFSFQRAFLDLKWKYFRLRAGLFMNETIAESLVNPNDLLFNDYSIVENVFNPGSSKGVMFTYLRRRFSINLGYSDGLRTGFSEIRSSTRADFAVTVRTQYAWGERGLGGFNRLVARRGTPLGIRLGGALHYQDGGRSQGTADVKILLGTLDLSVRGNGWSLLVSVTSGQDARADTTTDSGGSYEVISSGVSATGGYFVLKDLQIFGQYALVSKPRIQGEPPQDIPGIETVTPSAFHAFGVGLSYFVIPGYDNVKLSTDFQYFLGRELDSSVPASPLNNIAPNDDGSQFFWRIQISAAF
jgi:hypothetical protein